jgi:TPR repeat protein
MKKSMGAVLLLLACASVRADELADGVKAWERRDFATAQTIFGKLASAGNPQAQLLLGEMYGYGEGVPEDLAQAERLLGQARAAGNKDAAESLENVHQRAKRKADIASFADAAAPQSLAEFGCVTPAFPEVSKTQLEIKGVTAKANDWRGCYERYGAYLKGLPAGGKALPPDVAKLMNLVELERARTNREQAYARAAAAASEQAAAFGSASDQWYARTKEYSRTMDKVTRDESARRQREIDDITFRAREATRAANPSGAMTVR